MSIRGRSYIWDNAHGARHVSDERDLLLMLLTKRKLLILYIGNQIEATYLDAI